MFADTQRQRFNSLDEYPCGIRRQGRTDIAQADSPQAQNKCQMIQAAEVMSETHPVITSVRLDIKRELGIAPVKVPGIGDNSADSGAVAANPF